MITKSDADRIDKTTLGGAGGNMAPIRTTTEEIERIVEIAILKLDLKYTGALNKLSQEMKESVDTKLLACREAGDKKRRWNFSAIFTTIMALTALGSAIATIWK